MAFNFGSSNNNNPAPAPTGFNLGGSTAPAPPSTGFSFGGATGTAAPAPTPSSATGGFNFGGSAPATNQPNAAAGGGGQTSRNNDNNQNTNANPPSTDGAFNFGGGGGGGASGGTGGAPTSTFGFSSVSNSQTTSTGPATGSFGFGGSTNQTPGNSGSTGQPTTNATPTTLTVPYYGTKFQGERIWKTIKHLVDEATQNTDQGTLAGQQLISILGDFTDRSSIALQLLEPTTPQYKQADTNLRQRLAQNPQITVTDSEQNHLEATLTRSIFLEVCSLSDDLQISEEDALSLYHYVSTQPDVQSRLTGLVDAINPNGNEMTPDKSVITASRKLYFYERSLILQTTLLLLQHRQKSKLIGRAVDVLLQKGLIVKMIALIRDYTKLVDQMLERAMQADAEASNPSYYSVASGASSDLNNDQMKNYKRKFLQAHIDFCFQERQAATESLFFAAYYVQFTVDEVSAILDLIKDLTNGSGGRTYLHRFDPFIDVPSPFQDSQATSAQQAQAWMGAATNSSWPQQLKERDPIEWQNELVEGAHKTGCPALLRCTGTLIVTCMAALSSQNILVDRMSHEHNIFGQGNALLPPGSRNTELLAPIHSRLRKEEIEGWKRPDVLGLLMASYAMLLRSSLSTMTSPRAGYSPTGGNSDLRKTWRECMEYPARLRSFTFARLSLLPSLRKPLFAMGLVPSLNCDVSSFFLEVVVEFSANYLDVLSASGDRPVSRAKWEQDAEDDLQIRRSYQEQQRKFHGQFRDWSDSNSDGIESVPTSVDILTRPDCMDDVIAFATAVCSLGPEYSLYFWSQENYVEPDMAEGKYEIKLLPSRALLELENQQVDDHSLRPSYLYFLAALARAKSEDGVLNGAAAIHAIFTGKGTQHQQNWNNIIDILRHYVRELNPNAYSSSRSSNFDSRSGFLASSSTAYYYFDDVSSNERLGLQDTAGERLTSVKIKELGEENTPILLSHLALITNVASNCHEARSSILSTSLPIRGHDEHQVVGQDSTLNVLFTLSVMPLTPELRGAVFKTIASLLSLDGIEDDDAKNKMQELAIKGWELLETCQIVPIHILEQYPSARENSEFDSFGLTFPPSSTALAVEKPDKSWIPADPRFSIIYEMEYVESSVGVYPSTESFLELLAVLFQAGDCVANLGNNWRVRTGTTPYVEYVMNFVLPRATGRAVHSPRLPFRSSQDANRLVSISFEVIDCILARYVVPFNISTDILGIKGIYVAMRDAALKAAQNELGHRELSLSACVAPSDDGLRQSLEDFGVRVLRSKAEPAYSVRRQYSIATANEKQPTNYSGASLPRVMSGGFLILADLLSPAGGNLFRAVTTVLNEANIKASGLSSDRYSLAYALYGATPPTFSSAREGATKKRPSILHQSLIKSLYPASEDPASPTALRWGAKNLRGALRLLCLAVAREDFLNRCLRSSPSQITIVPMLRFQQKLTVPKATDVQIAKVSQLLLADKSHSETFTTILDCIGSSIWDEKLDAEISAAACAILFYMDRSSRAQAPYEFLSRYSGKGFEIAHAFGTRILIQSERQNSADVGFLKLVLETIASNLRSNIPLEGSLLIAMLGMPSPSQSLNYHGPRNSLVSILNLLDSQTFVLAQETSMLASLCYEIIFRLTHGKNRDLNPELFHQTVKRLRLRDFWKVQLQKMHYIMSNYSLEDNAHVIHSLSWLMKGVAGELHLLAGASQNDIRHENQLAPQPNKYNSLSLMLYVNGGVLDCLLRVIPIEKVRFDGLKTKTPEEAVGKAKESISGSPEVVDGYQVIDPEHLIKIMSSIKAVVEDDEIRRWAQRWNHYTVRDCASAHLSDAIYLLLGSSVTSYEYLSTQKNMENISAYGILINILNRILVQPDTVGDNQYLSFDERFYTTATRNLALATMMASRLQRLMNMNSLQQENSMQMNSVCHLLAQSLACSGTTRNDNNRVNDRTSALACSLATILHDVSKDELLSGAPSHFVNAAIVLSKLSSNIPSRTIPACPTKLNLSARSCLSLVLVILDSENLVLPILTQSTSPGPNLLQSLLSLIPLLDANISTLLTTIAFLRGGTNLLYASGIMEALHTAATKYMEEESVFLGQQSHNVQYKQTQVAAPSFLLGHFELLNAMLVSDTKNNAAREIASKSKAIVELYSPVIVRLINMFPLDGDVLHSVIRCMALAKESCRCDSDSLTTYLPSYSKNISNGTHFNSVLEVKLAMLSMEIAQHPLPRELLPPQSYRVKVLKCSNPLILTLPGDTNKLWWDSIEGHETVSLDNFTCNIALRGVHFLLSGLSLIRGSELALTVDAICLCQALHSCVVAMRYLDALFPSIRAPLGSETSLKEDQAVALMQQLSKAVVGILGIIHDRLRFVSRNGNVEQGSNFKEHIASALYQTRLDTAGLGLLNIRNLDENQVGLVLQLGAALRKEIS